MTAEINPRILHGLAGLESVLGQEAGVSPWTLVTQERIDAFAQATGDNQWIHVDPERAAKESPFKGTIAHGFFTLALAPALLSEIVRVEGVRLAVNYGLNRVRFTGHVPVNRRVRMRASLQELEKTQHGAKVTLLLVFELENQPKPVCVMENVVIFYF